MSSSIAFNDGVAATLTNGRVPPFDRFWSYRPVSRSVGDSETILGTQRVVHFPFAVVRGAAFEIRDIPAASQTIADRLKLHLETGGAVTLNTGDGVNGPYTAAIMPGTEVEIRVQDERRMLLSVAVTLVNTTLGTPLVCAYAL